MKQLSVEITKLVVLWHEDGHSEGGKKWSQRRKRKERKRGRQRNDRECSWSPVSLFSLCIPRKKSLYPNKTISKRKLSCLPFHVDRSRVSSSSLLSFSLPPAPLCLSELARKCFFLTETAAWTNSRWAKEEAGLSLIQTLLWIAAGGWCIQIPQTLTGLFSWWRPWGEGDRRKN